MSRSAYADVVGKAPTLSGLGGQGIKSPGRTAAVNWRRLKVAATSASGRCSEQKQDAACGRETVLSFVLQNVALSGNQVASGDHCKRARRPSDGAPARRRTHLRKPRPDRLGRRVDRDRARRDAVCVLEHLIPRQTRGSFFGGRSPV